MKEPLNLSNRGQSSENDPGVRRSVLAGLWYSADPLELSNNIDNFIEAGGANFSGEERHLKALIVPHAGHKYSGPVGGYAYALLKNQKYDNIILIGPNHRTLYQGLLVAECEAYATPLGEVAVSLDGLDFLRQYLPVQKIKEDQEHSLEIQLPFLQRALAGEFKILPLMLGSQDTLFCAELANSLVALLSEEKSPFFGQKNLLIASSDLSHYYTASQAHTLDRYGLALLCAYDLPGYLKAIASKQTQACGYGAIVSVMETLSQLTTATVTLLNYATSGDVTGDNTQVVGYAALSIY